MRNEPLDSNHDACLTARVNIFRHLYAKRHVSFAFAVRNSESSCQVPLIYYLRYKSSFSYQIVEYYRAVYEIPDLFNNTLCAIRARIDFVERNESSSGHMR